MKTIATIFLIALASTLWALPPQSNHAVLKAVPAPKPVTIDGHLDEWDLSGEMYVYGVRNIRDRYSVDRGESH